METKLKEMRIINQIGKHVYMKSGIKTQGKILCLQLCDRSGVELRCQKWDGMQNFICQSYLICNLQLKNASYFNVHMNV